MKRAYIYDEEYGKVYTKYRLLWVGSEFIPVPPADWLAQRHGLSHAEEMVRHLESLQKQPKTAKIIRKPVDTYQRRVYADSNQIIFILLRRLCFHKRIIWRVLIWTIT